MLLIYKTVVYVVDF